MKKTKRLSLGFILAASVVALPFLGNNTKINAVFAEDYGSVGNWYWDGINCTVEEFRNKGCTGNATSPGFTTEITPNEGAKNVRVTFNETVKGSVSGSSGEQMFGFSQYKDGDETIATADMIVITLKNAKDLTKSISVVNRVHSDVWNAVGVSFTDDIELHDDGYAYIKGTNQAIMGQESAGTYNKVGKIFNSSAKTNGPLFGTDYFYVNITSSGDVRHNEWSIYANILDTNFLANSRANLPTDNPYYERYTTEWAQSVLTAMADQYNVLQVTYYNIHTSEPLAFRMTQVDNQWLGTGANKLPSMTYPFSLPKQDSNFNEPVLYTGGSYTIGDVIERHNRLEYSEGYTTKTTGWNDAVTHNDATWIAANNLSKPFTSSTPGTKGASIYTYCNASGSWSDRYLYQDIYFEFLDASPSVSPIDNTEDLVFGTEYDLKDFFEYSAPLDENPTVSFMVDGVTNASGKITGDGNDHVVIMTVTDNGARTNSGTINLKHAHRFGEWVPEVPDTCTSDGTKGHYVCQDCGKNFDADGNELDTLSIPMHDHDIQKIDGKNATCIDDGWKDYYQCDECKTYYEDAEGTKVISNIETWKANEGKTSGGDHYCTKIDGHAPTCEQDGWHDYYQCEGCKKYFSDSEGKNEIQDVNDWILDEGRISATGHQFGGEVTYSWNGNECTASHKCQHIDCNETETETVTGIYSKSEEATCTTNEKGYYLASFTNSAFVNQRKDVELENTKLGHEFGNNVTYTWDGSECTARGKCKRCDEELTETVIGTFVVDTQASCIENETGHYEAIFTTKGLTNQRTELNSVSRPNSALGHDLIHHEEVPATQTSQGCKEYWECSRCHKLYLDAEGTQETTMDGLVIDMLPKQGGCKNSIASSSLTILVVSIIGTLSFLYKKRKEN